MSVFSKIYETDLLIVGGGIGGLMAAISARQEGADVLVAEKAHIRRSGNGATGNDHFVCYIPEVHGDDMDVVLQEFYSGLAGSFQDKDIVRRNFAESFERVLDWERWGIPMRPFGYWDFTGHSFPGRPRIWLKYEGATQKAVLAREAMKSGAKIVNKLSIVDLVVRDGRVLGAVGIVVRDADKPELVAIRAKSVMLQTGSANRLFNSVTPGWMFNICRCPSDAGAGRATAYRAGAKLVNMDVPYTHAGPKYFSRSGKGTWIGVLTDYHGKRIGPFVDKPNRECGDVTVDVWTSVYSEKHKDGSGPVYMDCTQTSEEDLAYMKWGLSHEGNTTMLEYMENEGIDLRKHKVEFSQYECNLRGRGGIEINAECETNIKGLYAGGDDLGNYHASVGGAATTGWIGAKNAVRYAAQIAAQEAVEDSSEAQWLADFTSAAMSRVDGPTWKEGNVALSQIITDYAGVDIRSETLMLAGREYLGNLKRKFLSTVTAPDTYSLMRTLEVRDMLEIGDVIFLGGLERKESRGHHKRSDFPFTNPLLSDKMQTVRLVDGQPVVEWRKRH
ncbi:MAG: FAD-binding protein [Mailhella sp.]|nr:FAD-binding protein [Mailhella sp.]MBQ3171080.1 FAD-binding protein [Mailhella sp.]